MAIGNTFKLAKLTIEAFTDEARKLELKKNGMSSNRIEVMYNPEMISIHHENAYQGETVGALKWIHSGSQRLDVKLVFDGTNVSHFGFKQLAKLATVAERVQDFLNICFYMEGESHEPPFLRLTWGEGIFDHGGFECRLLSVDVNYTAFDRDGSPLRAELSATFVRVLDPPKKAAEERTASPDLTHRRVVRAGDSLPLLCREIYGSATHYLRVAQVNDLDDFSSLSPGQVLIFPPFARRGSD